ARLIALRGADRGSGFGNDDMALNTGNRRGDLGRVSHYDPVRGILARAHRTARDDGVLADNRSWQERRALRQPHVARDVNGCDANGRAFRATIGSGAVKIGVGDADIGQDAIIANGDLANAAEPCAAQQYPIAHDDSGIVRIGPRCRVPENGDVGTEDHFAGSANAKAPVDAEARAGAEAAAEEAADPPVPVTPRNRDGRPDRVAGALRGTTNDRESAAECPPDRRPGVFSDLES